MPLAKKNTTLEEDVRRRESIISLVTEILERRLTYFLVQVFSLFICEKIKLIKCRDLILGDGALSTKHVMLICRGGSRVGSWGSGKKRRMCARENGAF